jgi:hypothetical protein
MAVVPEIEQLMLADRFRFWKAATAVVIIAVMWLEAGGVAISLVGPEKAISRTVLRLEVWPKGSCRYPLH